MKPKRFAAYVRVSADRQEEQGHSLDQQRAFAQTVVAREGGTLVHVYGGTESAMGKKPRIQFDLMLRDAAKGKFDALVISSDDRHARNPVDIERLRDVFLQHGVALFIGGAPQDLRSSAGRIGAVIKAVVSNEETNARLDTSAQTRIMLAAMGFVTGGTPPFGRHVKATLLGMRRVWETNENGEAVWEVDPLALAYVRRAYQLRIEGATFEEVAAQVTWPGDKVGVSLDKRANAVRRRLLSAGGDWVQIFALRGNHPEDFTSIRNIDRVSFRDGEAHVRMIPPALLSDDEIQRLRAMDVKYIDRKSAATYALSRIVRCHCGSTLSEHRHKGGQRYMQHPRRANCPHSGKSFGRAEDLERDVLSAISEMLRSKEAMSAAVRQAREHHVPEREALRAELAALKKAQQKDDADIRDGLDNLMTKLTPATARLLGARIEACQQRRDKRVAQIEAVEARLLEAEADQGEEAMIAATVARFTKPHSLLRAKPQEQRAAMRVLFGGASLRKMPATARQQTPDVGVFVRWAESKKTGERYRQWVARGRFFDLRGNVTWDETLNPGGAEVDRWAPSAGDLAAIAGAYELDNASTRARSSSARWTCRRAR